MDTRFDTRSSTPPLDVRRPSGGERSASRIPNCKRFADCSALAEVLSDQHAAIFCLGAYTGTVSDTELRTITVDYTIEFARVLHGNNPDAAFAFLSGSGADPTGRSRMSFARYKGEAENALLAKGFASVFIFRPA